MYKSRSQIIELESLLNPAPSCSRSRSLLLIRRDVVNYRNLWIALLSIERKHRSQVPLRLSDAALDRV